MDRSEITFESLMEKFKFHHNIYNYHLHMSRIAGEHIKENFLDEAIETGKFLPEFFEEVTKTENKPYILWTDQK